MATFNHGKKFMGHNLKFDRRLNFWMFVVTFVLLFHVGHGSKLEVCSWSDISGNYISAGTHSVPEAGCRMKKYMWVNAVVTIEGVSGTFRVLQSNRVYNYGGAAGSDHRHFKLFSGKLTLNYLKLTWGETGNTNGGFIYMVSGTLAINWVHFDGSKTKTSVSHAKYGGCIYVIDGKVTIKKSTFEGFRATHGGAIYVQKTSDPMTIESTTFKNNEATVRFIFAGIH